MSSQKDNVTTSADHLLGRVKWFNNKAGYGFITVTDGARSGSDIFVHHSAINVENQQYKYLVQGEYVEFDLVHVESSNHEWQASNVSGVKGGKLMCETRHDLKMARNEYKSSRPEQHESNMPRQKTVNSDTRPPRSDTRPPRSDTRPPRSDTRPPRSDTRPPRSDTRPPRSDAREGDNKKGWTLVGEKPRASRRDSASRTVTATKGSTVITIQSK